MPIQPPRHSSDSVPRCVPSAPVKHSDDDDQTRDTVHGPRPGKPFGPYLVVERVGAGRCNELVLRVVP